MVFNVFSILICFVAIQVESSSITTVRPEPTPCDAHCVDFDMACKFSLNCNESLSLIKCPLTCGLCTPCNYQEMITHLQEQIDEMKSNVNDKIDEMRSDVSYIESKLLRAEQGRLRFLQNKHVTVRFSRAFREPPIVSLSLYGVYPESVEYIVLQKGTIRKDSFDLKWDLTKRQDYGSGWNYAQWTAIGRA